MSAKLSKADVRAYLRLHAQKSKIEPKLEKLREKILPALQAGAVSPVDLPFILVNQPQKRTTRDYKKPLLAALRLLLGKTKAFARLQRIEARFKKTEYPSLVVRINPDYASKL